MASMNKPVVGDVNWWQALTNNWTSIEQNLIDKNVLTTKGDLFVASGAGALGRLGVGSDGQVLTANSLQTLGVDWEAPTLPNSTYMDQLVLDKKFFSDAGLLPGTKYYETAADQAPTPDWDNTGVVPIVSGVNKRWEAVASTQLLGWDLGATKHRILLICSVFQNSQNQSLLFVSDSKPTSGDFTTGQNGYAGGVASATGPIDIITNGTYSALGSTTTFMPFLTLSYGIAFLFGNGAIRIFFRWGNFQWVEGIDTTDGTYTALRYVGVRMYNGGYQSLGPVSIWYDP